MVTLIDVIRDISKKLNDNIKTKIYYFNTVADMKTANVLKAGDMVLTKGYYAANDGGNGEYEILSDDTLVDDGGSIHNIGSTLKARLIVKNNEVNSRQFGLTDTDSSNASNLFKFGYSKKIKIKLMDDVIFDNTVSQYCAMYQVYSDSTKKLTYLGLNIALCDYAEIKKLNIVFEKGENYFGLYGNNIKFSDCTFTKNVLTDGSEWKSGGVAIKLDDSAKYSNLHILDCKFYNFEYGINIVSSSSDKIFENLYLENVCIYNSRAGLYTKYVKNVYINNFTFENTKDQQELYRNITDKVSWTYWHHAGKSAYLNENTSNITINNFNCKYPEERALYNSSFENLNINGIHCHNSSDYAPSGCVIKFDGVNGYVDNFNFTFDEDKDKTYPYYKTDISPITMIGCNYGAISFRNSQNIEVKNGTIDFKDKTSYAGMTICGGSNNLKIHDIIMNNAQYKPIFMYYSYDESKDDNSLRDIEIYRLTTFNTAKYVTSPIINISDDYHTSGEKTEILLKNISVHDCEFYLNDKISSNETYSEYESTAGTSSIIYANYIDGFNGYNNNLYGLNRKHSNILPYSFENASNILLDHNIIFKFGISDHTFMGSLSSVSYGSNVTINQDTKEGKFVYTIKPKNNGNNTVILNDSFIMDLDATLNGCSGLSYHKLFSTYDKTIDVSSLSGWIEITDDFGNYGKFILVKGNEIVRKDISDNKFVCEWSGDTQTTITVYKNDGNYAIRRSTTNTDNLYVKARFIK